MTVTYLDPAGEASAPLLEYDRRLDPSRRPLTLGLVANSFPDCKPFVDCLERALAKELPGTVFKRYQKPAVDPISPEMLATLTGECDAAIAAMGH